MIIKLYVLLYTVIANSIIKFYTCSTDFLINQLFGQPYIQETAKASLAN